MEADPVPVGTGRREVDHALCVALEGVGEIICDGTPERVSHPDDLPVDHHAPYQAIYIVACSLQLVTQSGAPSVITVLALDDQKLVLDAGALQRCNRLRPSLPAGLAVAVDADDQRQPWVAVGERAVVVVSESFVVIEHADLLVWHARCNGKNSICQYGRCSYTKWMKPILIIQNITREQAGLIEVVFNEQDIPFHILDLSKESVIPSKLEEYSGVVMMGGPDSANDTTPKMQNALQLAKQALDLQLPYLGICLGHQVLAKAAGGRVVRSPVKEVGWNYTIQITPTGLISPLLKDLPTPLPVFQLHGEMVITTPEMQILASGEDCPVHIIQCGSAAYGLQCHLELTDVLYQIWLDQDPDLRALNRSQLEQAWQTAKVEYTTHGKQLIHNWLQQFSS